MQDFFLQNALGLISNKKLEGEIFKKMLSLNAKTENNEVRERRKAFKTDFESFLVYFYDKLKNPKNATERKQFTVKFFHKEILRELQNLVLSNCGNTLEVQSAINYLINFPPRHGKSTILCYWIAWCFTINLQCNFIYTSYSQGLVHKMSQEIKDIMECPEFVDMYPNIKFHKKKDAKGIWSIQGGGEFIATALGGQIVGFGAGNTATQFGGAIIIDDPLKPDDAKYPRKRQNALDYYNNTLKSRRNSIANTPIILIMQRLHVDDLAGYILENEPKDWKHYKYVAFDENKGQALWENVMSAKELMKLKLIDPKIYYGQYQQEPIIEGGNLIKAQWFRTFSLQDLATLMIKKVYIVGDTAFKTQEHHDYSVFTVFATDNLNVYILDMVRGKWEATPLHNALLELWEKWKSMPIGLNKVKCQGLHIEDKVSGTGLIQNFQREGIPITPIPRTQKDKSVRFSEVELYFSNGRVFLPSWDLKTKQEIIAECIQFTGDMSHKHDDIVDTLIDGVQIGLVRIHNTLISMYGK